MRMVSLDPLVPSALIHALADIQQFVCRKAAMVGGPGTFGCVAFVISWWNRTLTSWRRPW
jgi:hypothetical protein